MALAIDLEYFRVDLRYCDKVKCCDVRNQYIHNWNEICDAVPGLLCFPPFNKVSFQYVTQIVITTLSGATYLFNLLDVAQNEFKIGQEKKISDCPHPEKLQNIALRLRSQPWRDFITFLTDRSVIFLGWGKRNTVQVFRDTSSFESVNESEKRVSMSSIPGNTQLQRQIQRTEVQKAFSILYIPWMASYDGDDPMSMKLDAEPTISAGAELDDQPSDEPAIPTAESVAKTNAQLWEREDHAEGLNRFERFRKSLTHRTRDATVSPIPMESPSQQSASSKD